MAGRWLDERYCRELWECETGSHMTDEQWDQVWFLATGGAETPGFLAPSQAIEALQDAADRLRATWGGPRAPGVVSIAPPRRWASYAVKRMEPFEAHARWVRELFGLEDVVEYERVPELIREAEREQLWPSTPHECRRVWYPVNDATGWETAFVCLWDESECPVGPFDRALSFTDERTREEWKDAWRRLRLAELWNLMDSISTLTGMHTFAALHWVLCGGVAAIPWIEAASKPPVGDGHNMWVEITVGSHSAKPEEVAAAYAEAVRRAVEDFGHDLRFPVFGRSTPVAEDVYAFCNQRRLLGSTWQEIADEWNEDHPDAEYSADTLSRKYRRARDAMGGGQS